MNYRKVGLLYHPRQRSAHALAVTMRDTVLSGREVWLAATGEDETARANMQGTDLLVCIGGDGTVLWAARTAVPHEVDILSVNMGRLGFLTEVEATQAEERLGQLLRNGAAVEGRAMLDCTIWPAPEAPAIKTVALNDVVVGRGAPGRPVYLSLSVDAEPVTRVRADAVIVSTATGSTAYSLSAGGPVLMPGAQELLVTPVAPHLSRLRPMVLPAEATVRIAVDVEHVAVVSADGQADYVLESGSVVECRRSEHQARFIRFGSPADFFAKLSHYLNQPGRSRPSSG